MNKNSIAAVSIIGASVLTVLVLWGDTLLDEALLSVLGDTTEYVDGYSEEIFYEIKIGDTLGDVQSRLPRPFRISELPDAEFAYEYTRSFRDSHFRRRMIFFKDGKVVEISDVTHID